MSGPTAVLRVATEQDAASAADEACAAGDHAYSVVSSARFAAISSRGRGHVVLIQVACANARCGETTVVRPDGTRAAP